MDKSIIFWGSNVAYFASCTLRWNLYRAVEMKFYFLTFSTYNMLMQNDEKIKFHLYSPSYFPCRAKMIMDTTRKPQYILCYRPKTVS